MSENVKVGGHVRFVVTDDGGVILNVETGKYYSLNKVGAAVWNGLRQRQSEEEIVENLSKTYKLASERLRADVQSFVRRLANLHLFEE